MADAMPDDMPDAASVPGPGRSADPLPDSDPVTEPIGLRLPPDPVWEEIARAITFATAYERLWTPGPRGGSWFAGGRLNLSVNCLDRHLPARRDQVAIHWEGEPGDRVSLTYGELYEQVLALTRALHALGVRPGDRVGLHLGWLPETVVAMLACVRLGAVHTLIPVPLPTEALADRIADLELRILFTQDGAWRRGAVLPLKARADEALAAASSVQHLIVVRRTGMDVPWFDGDRWYHDLVAGTRGRHRRADPPPVLVPAQHPVCTISLANRGGHPVSVLHGTATMLAGALAVHRLLDPSGVFWCAGEVSWTLTQFHGIYGPLASGATAVMCEGTLDVPSRDRAWQIIERYAVESLVTTPSVVRTMRGWARELPPRSRPPSLGRVTTAGEPMDAELSQWLLEALGAGVLDVADGWGQLELGGIVRLTGLRGESLPDCGLDVVDPDGRSVGVGEPGEIVLRKPWPSTMVGIEGPGAPNIDRHWTRHPGGYATGDLAERTGPDAIAFLGRTDDVVSISGQLVALQEVRQVLAGHPQVAQVDVTWRKDQELGRALIATVCLRGGACAPGTDQDYDAVAVELMETVREVLGGLARPRSIVFLDRFGDELSRAERALAIADLARPDREGPRLITWAQVLAAAGHTD